MQPDFWLERWREGRIGFHREEVMPLLVQHWPALAVPAGRRVFVPLAGKTLDMIWLAAQGHPVLGAELSPLAVQQFFEENGPAATGDGHTGRPPARGRWHRVDARRRVRAGRPPPWRPARPSTTAPR